MRIAFYFVLLFFLCSTFADKGRKAKSVSSAKRETTPTKGTKAPISRRKPSNTEKNVLKAVDKAKTKNMRPAKKHSKKISTHKNKIPAQRKKRDVVRVFPYKGFLWISPLVVGAYVISSRNHFFISRETLVCSVVLYFDHYEIDLPSSHSYELFTEKICRVITLLKKGETLGIKFTHNSDLGMISTSLVWMECGSAGSLSTHLSPSVDSDPIKSNEFSWFRGRTFDLSDEKSKIFVRKNLQVFPEEIRQHFFYSNINQVNWKYSFNKEQLLTDSKIFLSPTSAVICPIFTEGLPCLQLSSKIGNKGLVDVEFSKIDREHIDWSKNKSWIQAHRIFGIIDGILIVVKQKTYIGSIFSVYNSIWQVSALEYILLPISGPQPAIDPRMTKIEMLAAYFAETKVYFADRYDLTTTIMGKGQRDESFLANKFLTSAYYEWSKDKGLKGYFSDCVEGHMERAWINATEIPNPSIKLFILSKRQWLHSGPRYYARGVDKNGFVGNFVETEIVVEIAKLEYTASFIQCRGSIPLYWKQTFESYKLPKFQIDPAKVHGGTKKHFEYLKARYLNMKIVVLNLIRADGDEKALLEAFNANHPDDIEYIHFDFHANSKHAGFSEKLMETLEEVSRHPDFAYEGKLISSQQTKILRVNCVDCLDRTNVSQSIIAFVMVQNMIHVVLPDMKFTQGQLMPLKQLWENNAIAISKYYTGTKAVRMEMTCFGFVSFLGALKDKMTSMHRYYQNLLLDGYKYDVMNYVYGKTIPFNEVVVAPHPTFTLLSVFGVYITAGCFLLVAIKSVYLTHVLLMVVLFAVGIALSFVTNIKLWMSVPKLKLIEATN